MSALTSTPATVGEPVLIVVAEPGAVRARIAHALRHSCVSMLTGPGREATAAVGDADVLVFQCERIGSGEIMRLRELRERWPDLRIVVVGAAASVRHTRRAVDCGADGLVLSDRLEESLAPTVAAVLAGQCVVPSQFGAGARKQPLSFREKQILGLAAAGYTNGQISAELFLAESTVKSHLSSAFTKLGVASRSEAAALILDPRESLGLGIAGVLEPGERLVPPRRG